MLILCFKRRARKRKGIGASTPKKRLAFSYRRRQSRTERNIRLTDFLSSLPAVNAILNSISAVLIVSAMVMIKRRRLEAHRKLMLAAVGTSGVFLISYVIKTMFHGTTVYGGTGLSRVIYLTVLFSHLSLAIAVVPLVLITVFHGLGKRFRNHRAIGKWTYPIWLYVSVTGVLVFLMLRPWY